MAFILAVGTPLPLGNLLLNQSTGATLLNQFGAGGFTLPSLFIPSGGLGIRNFITKILPNALIIASLILLAIILLGGLNMAISAGNPEAQQKSKDAVTNAALGFLLVIAAYWIVQIIQVVTGVAILK